jgi:hypothetical protein
MTMHAFSPISSPSTARSAGRVARVCATGGVVPRERSDSFNPIANLQERNCGNTPPGHGFAVATLPAFGGGGRFDIEKVRNAPPC